MHLRIVAVSLIPPSAIEGLKFRGLTQQMLMFPDVYMLTGADLLIEEQSMAGPPLTSPQGPDGARTPALSHLIWYTSVCLISSVHLSGKSGINLAVQHEPQILTQASELPFKGLTGTDEEVNSAQMWSSFQLSFIWLLQSCSRHHLCCSSVRECH